MRRIIVISVVGVALLVVARSGLSNADDAAEQRAMRNHLQGIDAKLKSFGRLPAKLTDEQIQLLHEKAVTLARLADWAGARKAMDVVVAQKNFDRSLVLNAARLDIRPGAGNPVRGANLLADYMRKSGIDEDGVDLM